MHKLVAQGLIGGSADDPRLLGGRRLSDARIVFPMPTGPDAALYETIELSPEGQLWSFTVQRFEPKPPYRGRGEPFAPYAVGYVELPGQVIVEARLVAEDFSALAIGAPMRLTLTPAYRDAAGDDVYTFAFAPIDSTTREEAAA